MSNSWQVRYDSQLTEREQRALKGLESAFNQAFLQSHTWIATEDPAGQRYLEVRAATEPYACLARFTLWDIENVERYQPDDIDRFVRQIRTGLFDCWTRGCENQSCLPAILSSQIASATGQNAEALRPGSQRSASP
jgi:hypothetical protein